MNTKTLISTFLAVTLTATASFARSLTQSDVDQIRPGYTTSADLVRLFGQPLTWSTWSTDGRNGTSAEWYFLPGAPWQSYVPLGPWFGGLDVKFQVLSVEAGPDGRVRTFTVYDSTRRVTTHISETRVTVDRSK